MKNQPNRFSPLVDRMFERLRAAPIDQLWKVAKGHGPSGERLTTGSNHDVIGMLDERFASKKALAKALEKPTAELASAALPLLAGVDLDAAGEIFASLVGEDLSGEPGGSDGAALAYGVSSAWSLLASTLSDDKMLALWRAGRMRAEALRPSAWARIPAEQVAQMIAEQKVSIDHLPAEALGRLPGATLIELWIDGRIDASKLPEGARGRIGAPELERAFRAGGKALDLAEIASASPAMKDPATAAALLDRLAGAAMEAPRGEDRGLDRHLSAGQLDLVEALIGVVAASRAPAGAAALRHLLDAGEARLASKVISALGEIDPRAARDAARAHLERAGRGELDLHRFLAPALVRAVLAADPAHGAAALAPFFTAEALATEAGRNTASAILETRAWGFRVEKEPEPLFEADPAFLDLGARMLDQPGLDARTFLASFDHAQVSAALVRAGWRAPKPAAPPSVTIPKKPRWLERYKKGEHEAVWAEIRGAGSDEALLAEAEKVAVELMTRVRKNLERITAALASSGYTFAAGNTKKALPAPSAKAGAAIKSLEKALGARLPLTLRVFYEVVGEVNLAEDAGALDDEPLAGLGAHDPLVIVPPKTAQALGGDAAFEARYPPELRSPYPRVYLGPDPRHKLDPATNEDDQPYRLVVTGAPDGLVTRAGREEPFVDHLRRTLLAGGFAALPASKAGVRAKLTKGLVEL
ncbi:MAG: hypothetical protein U0359_23910 [Byssovorax sp.]